MLPIRCPSEKSLPPCLFDSPSLEEDQVQAGRPPARIQTFVAFAVLAALGLTLAHVARADEQRASRLGLALSAGVTSLSPDLINRGIDQVNNSVRVIGEENNAFPAPIGHITASAFFQVEGRFFISDKLVAIAGFGRIKSSSSQELLPGAGRRLIMEGEILGVPRHIGMDYYFAPNTRGDVTWRPFVGGGFMDVVEAHGRVGAEFTSPDTVAGGFVKSRGEGPGFFVETGIHLMLPGRYSFIGSLNYHRVKANRLTLYDDLGNTHGILLEENGAPAELDFSGIALKVALNINLRNKFQ